MRKLITIAALLPMILAASLLWGAEDPEANTVANAEAGIHPPFKKIWEYVTEEQFDSFVVNSDAVYYGTSNSYGAVDLATGVPIWTKSLGDGYLGVDVAFHGETLYVSIGEQKLIACDPKTGRELWSVPRKGYSGPMSAFDGVLYFEQDDGILSALDVRTRNALWTRNLERGPVTEETWRDLGLSIRPVAVGGQIMVGTCAGEVLCLDRATGDVKWRKQIGLAKDEARITGMLFSGGNLYVVNEFGELAALSVDTGDRSWTYDAKWNVYGAPAPLGDLLVVYSGGTALHGVFRETGKRAWLHRVVPFESLSVPPVVLINGLAVVGGYTSLFAVDQSADVVWEWNCEEELWENPITLLADGFLLAGAREFYRFVMGEPEPIPTDPTQRRALAEALVGKLDDLSKDEKRKLGKLGGEAFEALLPVVRERLIAYEAQHKTDRDNSYGAFERFSDAAEILRQVATKQNTEQLLEFVQQATVRDSRSVLLEILADRTDDSRALPVFLDILRTRKPSDDSLRDSRSVALDFVAGSSDQAAVELLMSQMADSEADPAVRWTAFTNLARTGGKAGLKAVLAARDQRRTIAPLAGLMRLDKIAMEAKPKTGEFEWRWSRTSRLITTEKDKDNVLWGLVTSLVIGSAGDLWIARHDGGQWRDPVFSGVSKEQHVPEDWLTRFAHNANLRKDSDRDGWTDLVEKRLGTSAFNSDTDGDGLTDSKDKNPLAGPRELTDSEKVIAAAFEARWRFRGGRNVPALVVLPPGLQPLELAGWDSLIIVAKPEEKPPLGDFAGIGIGTVSFHAPLFDFQGYTLPESDGSEVICWNDDHTEAKVQVAARYGGLDGTGFDVHLKKFGDTWVAINMCMVWIS